MTQEIIIGEIADRPLAKKLLKLISLGKTEIFRDGRALLPVGVSRTKARRYAYRWRGSRRGRYWALLLQRGDLSKSYSVEEPIEHTIVGS